MGSCGPVFGQLVIGPAGSGKTTFCESMFQVLQKLGRRPIVINMDPANDVLPYSASIDVRELITVTDVMNHIDLGPNGALLYCIDFLNANFDWLLGQMKDVINTHSADKKSSQSQAYFLFDCPGQIELYTHHDSLKCLLNKLNSLSSNSNKNECDGIDLRLVAVNLVDSHYANDPAKFISVVINSLHSMLHLEMPHVNILSKVDLMQKYGRVHYGIDFYCEVLDLNFIVEQISDDPFLAKYKKLTKSLAGIIEDYSLVSFLPLDINKSNTLLRVLKSIDRANGYYLTHLETNEQIESYYRQCEEADFDYAKYADLLEK